MGDVEDRFLVIDTCSTVSLPISCARVDNKETVPRLSTCHCSSSGILFLTFFGRLIGGDKVDDVEEVETSFPSLSRQFLSSLFYARDTEEDVYNLHHSSLDTTSNNLVSLKK